MKKTIILCMLACLCFVSQLSAQNNDKKISYNMINEYGFYAGNTFGFEGVFINSIKFNKTNDLLGIGLGYTVDGDNGQGIPMFLNYRHYFDRGRTLQPLFNAAVGATYYFGYEDYYLCDNLYYPDNKGFGLYASLASGFKVKAFSFTAGFFMKSSPAYDNFNGGINIKVGYTF